MGIDKQPDQKQSPQYLMGITMAALGGQIGCLTLVIVFASLFLGRWLDQLLGTKPIILIILLVSSAPISLVLTFWVAMRTVKKINPQASSGSLKSDGAKEVDTSE